MSLIPPGWLSATRLVSVTPPRARTLVQAHRLASLLSGELPGEDNAGHVS